MEGRELCTSKELRKCISLTHVHESLVHSLLWIKSYVSKTCILMLFYGSLKSVVLIHWNPTDKCNIFERPLVRLVTFLVLYNSWNKWFYLKNFAKMKETHFRGKQKNFHNYFKVFSVSVNNMTPSSQ